MLSLLFDHTKHMPLLESNPYRLLVVGQKQSPLY